jgi:hypothetical protein
MGTMVANVFFDWPTVFVGEAVISSRLLEISSLFVLYSLFFFYGAFLVRNLQPLNVRIKVSSFRLNVLLTVSAVLFGFWIHKHISINIDELNKFRSDVERESSFFDYFIQIVFPLFLLIKYRNDRSNWIIAGFVVVSLSSLLTGFRSIFLGNVLSLLLVLNIKRSRVFINGLMMLVVLGIVGSLRNTDSASLEGIVASTILRASTPEMISIALSYMEEKGTMFSIQGIIEPIYTFLPRSIWSSKPLSWNVVMTTEVYGPYLRSLGILLKHYGGVSYSGVSGAIIFGGIWYIPIASFFMGSVIGYVDKLNSEMDLGLVLKRAVIMNVLLLVEVPLLGFNAIFQNVIFSSILLLPIISKK